MVNKKIVLGWREWAALPLLNIPVIKAKIDTGARTSSLHAPSVERLRINGADWVRFVVHPIQKNKTESVICECPLMDIRSISDSGGHRDRRFIISTVLRLGSVEREIEISLANRKTMTFRMLVGRTALGRHFTVDPVRSFLLTKDTPAEHHP